MPKLESRPWFHTTGKNCFAKYVPVYIANMKHLEKDHIESHQHLKARGFVICRSSSQKFKAVINDQTLEQTVNRKSKSVWCHWPYFVKKFIDTVICNETCIAEYANTFKSFTTDYIDTGTKHKQLGKVGLQR